MSKSAVPRNAPWCASVSPNKKGGEKKSLKKSEKCSSNLAMPRNAAWVCKSYFEINFQMKQTRHMETISIYRFDTFSFWIYFPFHKMSNGQEQDTKWKRYQHVSFSFKIFFLLRLFSSQHSSPFNILPLLWGGYT